MKYKITLSSRSRWYWFNGQRHREDGPACEWADGTKWWYLNDKPLTEAKFNARKA